MATTGWTDMTDDEKREYKRLRKAADRARMKAAAASGDPEPTTAMIREALADAALMLLAVDGPGSEQIKSVLARVFPGRQGLTMTIPARARRGRLRPKLLKA